MEEEYNFNPPPVSNLLPGVSGLMRVKNDKEFIVDCVESCINALDELIIVYNDCSDNSESVIKDCAAKYPQKIRVYEYKANLLANNLTKDEFLEALSLPSDSPRLLCNYYNFALSKAKYSHAIKIDADQFYFSEKLKYWCDIARGKKVKKRKSDYLIGKAIFNLYRLIRKISISFGKRFPGTSLKWSQRFIKSYIHFAEVNFCENKYVISLSGLNLFKNDKDEWFVPLGLKCSPMNILPPFNGENDHLLFKITDKTYFKPFASKYYNLQRSTEFSLIEEFEHPYTPINVGFCWYHLNACRKAYKEKAQESFSKHSQAYMGLNGFMNSTFDEIERQCDKSMFTLYQRITFSFLFENMKSDLLGKKIAFNKNA